MCRTLVFAFCVAVLSSGGCATYADDLDRAEWHFQKNQHERALALFRAIEPDLNSLNHADRARYAYLRGMNDYRLSGGDTLTVRPLESASDVDKAFRSYARYWLGLANSLDAQKPGSLRVQWKAKVDAALRDLTQDTYGVDTIANGSDSSESNSGSEIRPSTTKPGEATPGEAIPPATVPQGTGP